MPPFPPELLAAIGSSLFGGLFGGGANRRFRSNQTNNLNFLDALTDIGLNGVGLPNVERAREAFQSLLENSGLTPRQVTQQDRLSQFFGGIPSQTQAALTDLQLPPELQQQIQAIQQNLGQTRGLFGDIIQGRGRTAETGQAFDRALDIGTGRTGIQAGAEDAIQQVLGQRGDTAELAFLRDRAQDLFLPVGTLNPSIGEAQQTGLDILRTGGQTPESRQLFGQGQRLISSGGLTDPLRNILGSVQGQIERGGLTPEGRRLLNQLDPIIASGGRGGALLPFDTAISFARDQATTAARQAAEAQRRQAFQRGGQAGGVVASGLQNQALAEFADESLRAQAQAVQQAAANQQALQLQQLLGAAGTSADVIGNATRLLGQLNAVQGDVARATSQNLATGANLGIGSQNLANQRLGQGFDILSEAGRQQLQQFGLGSELGLGVEGLVSDRLRNAITGAQGLGELRLGGLELSGDLGQGMAARVDNALQGLLGVGNQQLGLLSGLGNLRGQNIAATQNQIQQQLSALGLMNENLRTGAAGRIAGAEGLAGLGGLGFGIIPSIISARTGTLLGQPRREGPFSQLGRGLLSGGLQGFFDFLGLGNQRGGGGNDLLRIPTFPSGGDNPLFDNDFFNLG